jgi:large subunit ribosomal protein L24
MMKGPDSGKQGKVIKVMRKRNRVVVEGVNVTRRHTKRGDRGSFQGGYWYAESPVHYSSLALVNPETKRPCKIQFVRDDAGRRLRVIKGSDGVVLPRTSAEMEKLKTKLSEKRSRVGPKDTIAEEVSRVTFDVSSLNPLKLPAKASLPEE